MTQFHVCCAPHLALCCPACNARQTRQDSAGLLVDLGFFIGGGVTLGTRATEASEYWGGLGLRENEIWAFKSYDVGMIRNVQIALMHELMK